MVLAQVFWVATEVAGLAVMRTTPIPQLVWVRYLVHLGFMLLVFGPRSGLGLIRTSRPALQIGRSLLMLGMPLSYMIAAREMPSERVWGGFWMAPLLVLGLARRSGGLARRGLAGRFRPRGGWGRWRSTACRSRSQRGSPSPS
jgi:hypothetical protein